MHDFILTSSNYINPSIIKNFTEMGMCVSGYSIFFFLLSFLVKDFRFGKIFFRTIGFIVLTIGLFIGVILTHTPAKNILKANVYTGVFKVVNNPEINTIQNDDDDDDEYKNSITIRAKDKNNNYQKFKIKNTKENREIKKDDKIQVNITNNDKPKFNKTDISPEKIVSTKKVK